MMVRRPGTSRPAPTARASGTIEKERRYESLGDTILRLFLHGFRCHVVFSSTERTSSLYWT